jgi:hypothetical protein
MAAMKKVKTKDPKKKKAISADKKLLHDERKNQIKMPFQMGIGVG